MIDQCCDTPMEKLNLDLRSESEIYIQQHNLETGGRAESIVGLPLNALNKGKDFVEATRLSKFTPGMFHKRPSRSKNAPLLLLDNIKDMLIDLLNRDTNLEIWNNITGINSPTEEILMFMDNIKKLKKPYVVSNILLLQLILGYYRLENGIIVLDQDAGDNRFDSITKGQKNKLQDFFQKKTSLKRNEFLGNILKKQNLVAELPFNKSIIEKLISVAMAPSEEEEEDRGEKRKRTKKKMKKTKGKTKGKGRGKARGKAKTKGRGRGKGKKTKKLR